MFYVTKALVPIPYATGTLRPGDQVSVEPVSLRTVRVHLPSEGVVFTARADKFGPQYPQ